MYRDQFGEFVCGYWGLKGSFVFHSQSFQSHLTNMSEYFKLPDFNPDLLDIAMVKSYVSSMKQEYISYWQNTLQHSQKLEFNRSFKTDHTLFFFYKNLFYKNVEAEIDPNFKNVLRTFLRLRVD